MSTSVALVRVDVRAYSPNAGYDSIMHLFSHCLYQNSVSFSPPSLAPLRIFHVPSLWQLHVQRGRESGSGPLVPEHRHRGRHADRVHLHQLKAEECLQALRSGHIRRSCQGMYFESN